MNSVDEQANRLTETLGKAFLSHRITLDDCRRIVAEVLKTTRKEALREAKEVAKSELRNIMILASCPGQSSAAWNIMWKLDRLASEGG